MAFCRYPPKRHCAKQNRVLESSSVLATCFLAQHPVERCSCRCSSVRAVVDCHRLCDRVAHTTDFLFIDLYNQVESTRGTLHSLRTAGKRSHGLWKNPCRETAHPPPKTKCSLPRNLSPHPGSIVWNTFCVAAATLQRVSRPPAVSKVPQESAQEAQRQSGAQGLLDISMQRRSIKCMDINHGV